MANVGGYQRALCAGRLTKPWSRDKTNISRSEKVIGGGAVALCQARNVFCFGGLSLIIVVQ